MASNGCRVCGDAAATLLCNAHDLSGVEAADYATSRCADPSASLIGAWDVVLHLPAHAAIGRSLCNDVAMVHASISSRHAELGRDGEGWTLTDLASTNGTRVDGLELVPGEPAPLRDGSRIELGDVPWYFTTAVIPLDDARAVRPTVKVAALGRRPVMIVAGNDEILTLQPGAGGGNLSTPRASVGLGALEAQLFANLVEGFRAAPDPEQAYLTWRDLAAGVGFRSFEVSSENVRELVARIRRKVRVVLGPINLIEAKRHVGYRLAAVSVTAL